MLDLFHNPEPKYIHLLRIKVKNTNWDAVDEPQRSNRGRKPKPKEKPVLDRNNIRNKKYL